MFDLTETVQRAIENMEFLAKEKNIVQSVTIHEHLMPFLKNIKGDEGRYVQILLNFLSNALKFSFQNGNV